MKYNVSMKEEIQRIILINLYLYLIFFKEFITKSQTIEKKLCVILYILIYLFIGLCLKNGININI